MSTSLMPNYARLPVTFLKGEGAYLWDTQGTRYLDALSGIAVCGLGHAHPAITAAICEQANHLLHTSNLYGIAHQQSLADALVRITGMDSTFFCNSGAEANEAALKIARLYGHSLGIKKPTVIVTEGSFHGRTLATLTATGNPKIQVGFTPLLEGFIRVPYDNIDAITKQHQDVVAVLVEPIMGEGGIVIPDAEYLANLRDLCDRHNWLLMLDEIQTGMGRTGKWCAYQHANIIPDVLSLAKGLGNGVPIGACLARGKVADILKAGTHGSTFGGNPLACRVALAVIQTIEQDNLLQRAQVLGEYFSQGLKAALLGLTGVVDIRIKGLMIGIELDKPCSQLVTKALEKQLLLNVTADRVIRLLPPLILSNTQADEIINIVSHLIRDFLKAPVTEG
ncbi:MAG: aspartate aminotransferase family protein [Thiotrichaceae bacterium]|nr:aspartate aminotransferase family protein [Thiotrichaceae bacterium]